MTPQPIPVTIIGGYLGAGKTTLLNHVLRNNAGTRFAVMVNDFGAINIDADLVESQDGDTLNLANGCVCCSLAGGFGTAMLSILDRAILPQRVIIEASGVSDPAKIAQYAHLPGFALDSVIVLADAETIEQRAKDKYVGRQVVRQLKGADLLLLNKTDLVSPEKLAQVKAWLQALVPDIRTLDIRHGQAPVHLLLAETTPEQADKPPAFAPRSMKSAGSDFHHDQDYATWSYSGDEALDGQKLRAWISGLSPDVLRGKGFLHLAEEPSAQFVFQLVGKRWRITQAGAWGDRSAKNQLVLIGLPGSLSPEALDTALAAMQVPACHRTAH